MFQSVTDANFCNAPSVKTVSVHHPYSLIPVCFAMYTQQLTEDPLVVHMVASGVARVCERQFSPGTGVSGPWAEDQAGAGGAPADLDLEREVEVGAVSWGRAPEGGSPG